MEKNILGSGERIIAGPDSPMDTAGLQAMLTDGPSGGESEVRPDIPPVPNPLSSQVEAPPVEAGTTDESVLKKPEDLLRASTILPPPEMQRKLKEKYGELRVVPIPFSRPDDKVKSFILRPLTRSQWRKAEESAIKIAEAKGGLTAGAVQELIAEKTVSQSIVWPLIPEHEMALQRAGLIPTLFGIVQKISWFFDPDALMDATFAL